MYTHVYNKLWSHELTIVAVYCVRGCLDYSYQDLRSGINGVIKNGVIN
jgi:hypothetical protein